MLTSGNNMSQTEKRSELLEQQEEGPWGCNMVGVGRMAWDGTRKRWCNTKKLGVSSLGYAKSLGRRGDLIWLKWTWWLLNGWWMMREYEKLKGGEGVGPGKHPTKKRRWLYQGDGSRDRKQWINQRWRILLIPTTDVNNHPLRESSDSREFSGQLSFPSAVFPAPWDLIISPPPFFPSNERRAMHNGRREWY